jgi:hypothetical protein
MRFYPAKLLLFVTVIFFTSCENKSNSWPAIAKADLDYIKQMVELNHPGYVDPDNLQFKTQLEQSYKNVINQLQYVHSLDAVLNLDNEFIASFADYHVSINLRFASTYKVWVGSKIERKHDKYIVTKIADNWPLALPPVGAELVSCDGRTSQEIMNYDILRYRYANYDVEYPRVKYASKLLIDDAVGYRKRAEKCVFRNMSGEEITLALQWKAIDSQLTAEWDSSIVKPDSFSVEKLNDTVTWVRLPSFQAEGAETEQLIKVLQSLAAMKLGAGQTIVFDVRGNGGGFLGIPSTVLQAVYGTPVMMALFSQETVKNNMLLRANSTLLERLKDPASIASMSKDQREQQLKSIAAVEDSIKQGLPFAQEPVRTFDSSVVDARPIDVIKNSLPRLIVFTDHFCASMCLSFVGLVLHESNNKHLGEITYADSAYSLIFNKYPFELPSKLGSINLPLAILGKNGPYIPSAVFEGDINDAAAVKNWVLTQVALY